MKAYVCKKIVFLGVCFDESLSFTSHIDTIIKKSSSRLNIIKIVSHKSWHLSGKTLISLNNCLIDLYLNIPFFKINSLSKLELNANQIQNCALRNIYKVWFRGGVTDILLIKAGMPRIIERILLLGNKCLERCTNYKNPLIRPLEHEFKSLLDFCIEKGCVSLNGCPLAIFLFYWNSW